MAGSVDIHTVGIIGAGQMGNGIAHVLALANYSVVVNDINQSSLDAARTNITKNLDRQISSEKINLAQRDATLERISYSLKLESMSAVDLVIEAATEDEAVKVSIIQALLPHLQPHTLLTTNTSSLSITRLASSTDRPDKFMGFHFMNPVPMMQLVELIRGMATSDETYRACLGVVERLDKVAASAADYPAFIVNRILVPMINEAVFALFEGVGDVQSIDQALKLGANHPIGPLALADLIGLDTVLSIMNVLHAGMGDQKYRPCPLLVKYVEAGWLGRKSQRGFYDYSEGPSGKPLR